MSSSIVVKQLGYRDYMPVWKAMQAFTNERDEHTMDECWVVEHPPVFTQGQAGKAEHVLNPGNIPVVQVDRGGQVTYHGPGQLVIYPLINIKRRGMKVRELVSAIENAVIELLADWDITACARSNAPGVYVDDAKICSLGLRIRRGCSFHGLALNVDMDLAPFSRINPCGLKGIKMTQIADFIGPTTLSDVEPKLVEYLSKQLGYNQSHE